MPEMPEVETIARKLRCSIAGKQVAAVYLSGYALRRPVPAGFAAGLKGRTIRSIHRRGKFLFLETEPLGFWLIHLGMSGRLFYAPVPKERPGHTHVSVQFTDGGELQFSD